MSGEPEGIMHGLALAEQWARLAAESSADPGGVGGICEAETGRDS